MSKKIIITIARQFGSGGREIGERVAQLAIVPFLKAEFEESDELSDTVRGAGGFGSTGTK